MLYSAIIIFALTALLGIYLFSYVVQKKETPKGVAFMHGPLGALGIILLIIYAICYTPSPWVALIVFILAALGGFVLIYRDITGKSLPWWMAAGHGVVAACGLVALIYFAI